MALPMTTHSEKHTKSYHKDKEHGIQSKNNLQSTFMNIQKWMDTMQLKPNLDKTDYIQLASIKHIEKTGYLIIQCQWGSYRT